MGRTELDGDQVTDVDEIRVGLLAERPTSPKAGWIYAATDVKKFYACFIDNAWVHVNPINLTGAVDGNIFIYDGATGFLIPSDVKGLRSGLDEDKPINPTVGSVYLATDTEIVYYCFEDGLWEPSYVPKGRETEFELNGDGDITIIDTDQIFEADGNNDMMPSVSGTQDSIFELVSNEITPKAS